jgi:hypothetical protein
MLHCSGFMLSFLPEGFVTNCNNISKCLQRNEYEVRQNLLFGCLALVVAAASYIAWYCRKIVSCVLDKKQGKATVYNFKALLWRLLVLRKPKKWKPTKYWSQDSWCTIRDSAQTRLDANARECKLLVLKFYGVYSVHYEELNNSRNSNKTLCYSLHIQYFA